MHTPGVAQRPAAPLGRSAGVSIPAPMNITGRSVTTTRTKNRAGPTVVPAAAAMSRGQRSLQPGGTVLSGYPLFHTHARPHLYSGSPGHSSKSSTDPYTGRYAGWPRGWRDRSKLSGWPRDLLRARVVMARRLGRISPVRGTVTQARDKAGNDIFAGRYTPVSRRTGRPAEGTGGRGTAEGSPPSRRRRGLAPDVLGWPWHPR